MPDETVSPIKFAGEKLNSSSRNLKEATDIGQGFQDEPYRVLAASVQVAVAEAQQAQAGALLAVVESMTRVGDALASINLNLMNIGQLLRKGQSGT